MKSGIFLAGSWLALAFGALITTTGTLDGVALQIYSGAGLLSAGVMLMAVGSILKVLEQIRDKQGKS